MSDPNEKSRYDAARAKQAKANEPKFPPPPKNDDPYNFRKPARAQTTSFAPPPQPKPKPRYNPQPAYEQPQPRQGPAPVSASAKMNAFARGGPRWDKATFEREEAARNEGLRGFQRMPAGGPPPQMPPRPMRQHPTAPRPPSNPVSPDVPNGQHPGFPGLSRTNSARRMHYPDDRLPPRSAYAHVRAGERPPPSGAASSYDTFSQSPPLARSQTAGQSPLRHTRSTEQTRNDRPERPPMFTRQTSRYASNSGEKTDVRGLGRSASVRNSPIDHSYDEESGPFGNRPHSHHYGTAQPHSTRHRSASPSMRQPTFDTSSSGSEDEAIYTSSSKDRPKAEPKTRQKKPDGLDSYVPSSNYTRIVNDHSNDGGSYKYPPPPPKDNPTRSPFPDILSPDEQHDHPRNSFRYARTLPVTPQKGVQYPILSPLPRTNPQAHTPRPNPLRRTSHFINGLPSWMVPNSVAITQTNFASPSKSTTATAERPKPNPIFQPAKFQHENWAESLRQERNLSPSKQQRGSKSKETRRPTITTSNSGDAMDVDPLPTTYTKPRSNSINLAELGRSAPLTCNGGLNGMHDDLKLHLPSESRAALFPDVEKPEFKGRLKPTDLPRPPRMVHPPSDSCLDRQSWAEYIDSVRKYVKEWGEYEERMIDHFHTRNRLVRTEMADNWVTSFSDGPRGDEVDEEGGGNGKKAGFGTYMEWLADDKMCHTVWQVACDRHKGCMDELGRVREKIKRMAAGNSHD